jgi:hypothetical protein
MAETLDNLDDALFGDFEDYLAGTLPEARRREVAARLDASPEARALLSEFTEAQKLFEKPIWEVAEPSALPSAQAILDRAKSRPTVRKSFFAGMKEWFGGAMWRPALASGLAVALLASGSWLVLRSTEKPMAVATSKSSENVSPAAAPSADNGDFAANKDEAPAPSGTTTTDNLPKTPAQPGGLTTSSPAAGGKSAADQDGYGKVQPSMSPLPGDAPKAPEPERRIVDEKAGSMADAGRVDGKDAGGERKTDTAEANKPKAEPAVTDRVSGGVPSPPPPPAPTTKTIPPDTEPRKEIAASEDAVRSRRSEPSAKKKSKPDGRGAPGSAGAGPSDYNLSRNAQNNRSQVQQVQSVTLTVDERDPALGQLRSIAARFGGKAVVNGNSVEIVVPENQIGECTAQVRNLNRPRREVDAAPQRDKDLKKNNAVTLRVTVKEKPE